MKGPQGNHTFTGKSTYTTCRQIPQQPDYLICTEETTENTDMNGKTNNTVNKREYKVHKNAGKRPFHEQFQDVLTRGVNDFLQMPFMSLFPMISSFDKQQTIPVKQVKQDTSQPEGFYYRGQRKPDSKIYDL